MQFPLGKKLSGVWEPTVAATVVTPSQHVGSIMELFQDRRGEMTEHTVLSPARTLLRCASYGSYIPIHFSINVVIAFLCEDNGCSPTMSCLQHSGPFYAYLMSGKIQPTLLFQRAH